MENDIIFRTKTGYCHVFPDRIVLTREGVIGDISKAMIGNNITRIILFYSVLAFMLFYNAFDSYHKGHRLFSIFFALLGFIMIYGIISSLNISSENIIERKRIKEIKFIKAFWGLTRSRIEVFFVTDSGQIKKRLIMLPGSMANGNKETEKAILIMKEEGLIQ